MWQKRVQVSADHIRDVTVIPTTVTANTPVTTIVTTIVMNEAGRRGCGCAGRSRAFIQAIRCAICTVAQGGVRPDSAARTTDSSEKEGGREAGYAGSQACLWTEMGEGSKKRGLSGIS